MNSNTAHKQAITQPTCDGLVPKSGFQTMPKYFWCWEGDSVREINQWGVNTDYHLAFSEWGTSLESQYFKGEEHAADPMEMNHDPCDALQLLCRKSPPLAIFSGNHQDKLCRI